LILTFSKPVLTTVEVNVARPLPVVFKFNVARALSVIEAIVRLPVAVPVFIFAVNAVAVVLSGVTVANAVLLLVSVMVNVPAVLVVTLYVPVSAAGTTAAPAIVKLLNDVPPENVAATILVAVPLALTVADCSAELVTPVTVIVPVLALVSLIVTFWRPLPVTAAIVRTAAALPPSVV